MSKYVDAIIGHAIGDAMGVPTEFCIREKLLQKPVKEMVSCPKVGQPAGSWSDDTSMEICTIESYLEKKEFDYSDGKQDYETTYKGNSGLSLGFIDRLILGLKLYLLVV